MRFRGVFALTCAVAIACGGSSTSDAPAPAPDAGGSNDGGPNGNDAANEDGGSPTDGGSDAGHRCANDPVTHGFCDDFEGPLAFGPNAWTRPQVYAAGRLEITNGQLVGDIVPSDAGGFNPATLLIERNWRIATEKDKKRLTARYRAKIAECHATPVDTAGFLAGVDREPGYTYSLGVRHDLSGVNCTAFVMLYRPANADAGLTDQIFSTEKIPIAAGTVVDYEITIEEQAGSVKIDLRADTVTKSITEQVTSPPTDTATFDIGVGSYTTIVPPFHAELDDFRFDYGK